MVKIPKGYNKIFLPVVITAFIVFLLTSLMMGIFHTKPKNEVFIGIEVGYDNVDDFFRFVDEIEDYVNLVVIGSLDITTNISKMITVGDYLYSKDLYFIPFMFLTEYLEDPNFFNFAEDRWGKHFLGLYLSEEPGGRQIDSFEFRAVNEAENYSDAAAKFQHTYSNAFQQFFNHYLQPVNVTTFTSDYALYWFDYRSGWDTVFTEFGWNYSRQLHVSLCRGATIEQNKDWGAIITWTYQNPPYIEDAEMLYNDLVLAYNNGAKYIIVFNYPTNLTEYGILTQEHLKSMQKFWTYVNNVPQPDQLLQMAYVLPDEYGYGFRGPNDKIWGLWDSDEISSKIWADVNRLVSRYEGKMDIIYYTPEVNQRYEKLIFWNGTTIEK